MSLIPPWIVGEFSACVLMAWCASSAPMIALMISRCKSGLFSPLFGVVLGAALQWWFTRHAERDKLREGLRSQAYADYLRAVAAASHLRSGEDLRDAQRGAADAKARIAVYGSAKVIEALGRFEEAGAVLTGGRAEKAFIALVSAMRPGSELVAERELKLVLLGQDAPQLDSRRGSPME